MKIAMIGTGYVGLVSGTCFSEFGFNVVCVDKDAQKIENLKKGIIPIYEPGLDDLVKKNVQNNRLSFTTNLKEGLEDVEAVFIAVGTPSRRGDGHADLTYVFEAAKEIASSLKNYAAIVTKSTVPVGTGAQIAKIIRETNPSLSFDMVSNPEFLREGAAINDFMRPDRVVIGVESKRAEEVMRRLYRPLYLLETPMVVTSIETAELIKYAANAFLATKISFINEIADICEKVGADVQQVAKGIGLDNRIGKKFLHAGPGYGGSCFPKDCLALSKIGQELDVPLQIVNSTIKVNDERKKDMANRIAKLFQGDIKGKKVAILGLTFKPNTDDMRDSPSLDIVPALLQKGAKVTVTDPIGMTEAQKLLKDQNLTWENDPYEAAKNADILVIITEWNEYRSLDLNRLKSLMNSPCIADLRNIYNPEDLKELGFTYMSIGRQTIYAPLNLKSSQSI